MANHPATIDIEVFDFKYFARMPSYESLSGVRGSIIFFLTSTSGTLLDELSLNFRLIHVDVYVWP